MFILQCYGEGLWSERRAGNFKKRTEKFKKEKRIGSLKVMDKIKKKITRGWPGLAKCPSSVYALRVMNAIVLVNFKVIATFILILFI